MSAVWFSLPVVQYCVLDQYFQRSFWHVLLGLSIAAAYPLSWHLSVVAIPSSGASFLPPMLGVSRGQIFAAHKVVARFAQSALAFMQSSLDARCVPVRTAR